MSAIYSFASSNILSASAVASLSSQPEEEEELTNANKKRIKRE
jgi:hypothetical protein